MTGVERWVIHKVESDLNLLFRLPDKETCAPRTSVVDGRTNLGHITLKLLEQNPLVVRVAPGMALIVIGPVFVVTPAVNSTILCDRLFHGPLFRHLHETHTPKVLNAAAATQTTVVAVKVLLLHLVAMRPKVALERRKNLIGPVSYSLASPPRFVV